MKTSTCLFLAAIAFFLGLSGFSDDTSRDLRTGLSHSCTGFSVEQVVLVGPDNMPMGTNEVTYGTKVAIVVEGLKKYVLKDNKAFPGLSLKVTDKAGAAVMGSDDLFTENVGYPPTDAAILRGTVTVGDPMKSGETYHVHMRIWDKNKSNNELVADVDLVVK